MDKNNSIVYLNKPIDSAEKDIIDVSTYVDKLAAAIKAGAKMIGVISPFGSGKSSVISLLEKKCSNSEKFVKISMWSQAGSSQENTNEFHKSFLYQLTSQIDSKMGTYVSRRLSKNYGFLKFSLHANYALVALCTVFIMLASALGFEYIDYFFPNANGVLNLLKITCVIVAIIAAIVLLFKADIVFSSNKSEGNRTIEEDEIMDLYRSIVLKPQSSRILKRFAAKKKVENKTSYIIVIEDLDRSSDPTIVIKFLKEIRKYYLPEMTDGNYVDDAAFIINVKPESLLRLDKSGSSKDNDESLYAKLFDYTLNLQTINIDNYDAILDGLLEEKCEQFVELGLVESKKYLLHIQGIQWIIRERKLGIREIKERLNIALTTYESLIRKFTERPVIEFEKCAVAAYLTTAFESDFYKTDDRAFEKMIDVYIKEGDKADYSALLPGTSAEYVSTVVTLISAKLIDSSYRIYFYNFPKDSHLYTLAETQIMNALLYGDKVDDIETVAEQVRYTSNIIQNSLSKLKDLKLTLPKIVFKSETIYAIALSSYFEKVIEFLNKMDYSEEATAQTIKTIDEILSLDKNRIAFKPKHAEAFCACWNVHFGEPAILKLRKMLCENYGWEINCYRSLFFDNHHIITAEEIQLLDFGDAVCLTNIDHIDFSESNIENLMNVFVGLTQIERGIFSAQFKSFLISATEKLGQVVVAPYLLQYMLATNEIVPDFEQDVVDIILTGESQEV